MRLLVFAHKGEAKAFLNSRNYKRVSLSFGELFKGKEDFILITGEDGIRGAPKLSFVLGRFPEIKEVFNLGLGGGLSPKVKLGEIYSIRTLYSEALDKNRVKFHSFTTNDKTATMDLISASQRVLNKNTSDFLENFAPIVDREGYYFAQTCKIANIPFYSAKLISDLPYRQSNKDICVHVQKQSQHYSTCLLDYYCDQYSPIPEKSPPSNPTLLNSDLFYLTMTMQKKYLRLSSSIPQEKMIEEEKKLSKLPHLSKKERGRRLLQSLSHLENPLRTQLQKDLDEYLDIFRVNNIEAQWKEPLESAKFVVKADIDSFQRLKVLINSLSSFDYEALQKRFSSF